MSEFDELLDQYFSKEKRQGAAPSTNIYFRKCQNILGEPPKPWHTDEYKCWEDTENGEPYCPKCKKGMHVKPWPRSKRR